MRRRVTEDEGSLDSLLDTMTNVVGILVILLVVTQMGVGEAVERIGESESVDPAILAEAEAELARARQERLELALQVGELSASKAQDAKQQAIQLQKLKQQILDARTDVSGIEQTRDQRALAAREQLEALRQLNEAHQQKVVQLEQQINDALGQVARLEAQLDTTPMPQAPAAKVVHLPNPRPAPEGGLPLTFICREGRIIPLDINGLVDRTQKRIMYIIRRGRLDRDPAAGIDCGKIADAFEDAKIHDNYFDVGFEARGRYPYVVFSRRRGVGETAEQLASRTSKYQQLVGRMGRSRYYLRFLVWPDSFDTYLAARRVAADRGIPAGWDPQTTTDEYTMRLPGKLTCGPPPKPQPKPQPKPPTKPGEQKPPPKPAPPKPVPPSDEID